MMQHVFLKKQISSLLDELMREESFHIPAEIKTGFTELGEKGLMPL